jgi:hypothetical protein
VIGERAAQDYDLHDADEMADEELADEDLHARREDFGKFFRRMCTRWIRVSLFLSRESLFGSYGSRGS